MRGPESGAPPILREQLSALLSTLAAGIVTLDSGLRITSFDAGAERFFGCEAGSVLGRPFDVLTVGRGREALRRRLQQYLGEPDGRERIETGSFLALGHDREIPADATFVRYGVGAATTLLIAIRDGSPAANAAGGSADQFRLLVDSVRDYAIFILDPHGNVASWNPGAQFIKGWTADEIIGRHVGVFYPTGMTDGWPEAGLRQAAEEGRAEDEGWRLRKDGSLFWANVVITALRAPDGSLAGYAKVTRDLTERRRTDELAKELIREQAARAEAESAAVLLRESEARFRAMADTAPVMIWVSGTDALFAWFNRPWLEFTGRTLEQEIGNGWIEGMHPDDRSRCVEIYRSAVDRREPFRMEYRRRRHDGHWRWVLDHGVPRLSTAADFAGYIGSCIDITERIEQHRELETYSEQLEELTIELETTIDELELHRSQEAAARREADSARRIAEEASQAKSQFLAVMSHELRTPLNAILGFTDLIAGEVAGPVTDQQREHLTRIQASSTHLLSLIDQLLALSRIEAGREDLRRENVDIVALARDTARLIEPSVTEKGLMMRLDVPDAEVMLWTDPGKIRQILLNLLNNAVKFTDEGEVGLGMVAGNGQIVVEVWDTGIGIPEDRTESIFELFTQLDRSRSQSRGGTGLGLSVTRHLARLLDGDVEVRSQPGGGSTFTVRLPRRAPALHAAAEE
jgi:PAS domain S-box-containing protein